MKSENNLLMVYVSINKQLDAELPILLKRRLDYLYNEQDDHHFMWKHYGAVGLENHFVLGELVLVLFFVGDSLDLVFNKLWVCFREIVV